MTADGLAVVRFIFSSVWRLFTSFLIPGTRTTPGEWALFALLFVITLKLINLIFAAGIFGGKQGKDGNDD